MFIEERNKECPWYDRMANLLYQNPTYDLSSVMNSKSTSRVDLLSGHSGDEYEDLPTMFTDGDDADALEPDEKPEVAEEIDSEEEESLSDKDGPVAMKHIPQSLNQKAKGV